ncbi:metal-sulfur cluster assembly factor [Plantactinospora siamensis]|uniref:Metal-sulfur cluster assembly factor n=1 Tax=Plantactinospora siamensis TaxID=555372 RepID=A0ABV6NR98_9ACTN
MTAEDPPAAGPLPGSLGADSSSAQLSAEERVRVALRTVVDPCLYAAGHDLSIVDLGLVRGVDVSDGVATVRLTFTEPGCQFTHHVVLGVTAAAAAVDGVRSVRVVPEWLPVWSPRELSPVARAAFAEARRGYGGFPLLRIGPRRG